MRLILHNIRQLWHDKLPFRLASAYLVLLTSLLLLLPWLPLPYSANYLDLQHIFQQPFSNTAETAHWLGTDAVGRDVLTDLLYGARTGFMIAIPVTTAATFIGLGLGATAGYFGDDKLTYSLGSVLVLPPLALFFLGYYGIYVPLHIYRYQMPLSNLWLSVGLLAACFAVLLFVLRPLMHHVPVLRKQVCLPLDMFVLRSIEVVASVPGLILVLLLASFLPASLVLLSLLLTLTSWTGVARLARAEMLRVKRLPYIEAGLSMGFSDLYMLFRHAMPNIIGPVVVAFSFNLAGLLVLESTLSFLGIGLPPTVISWGRIITGIRLNTAAWWLVAFPGGLLALTVLSLQICSYYLLAIIRNK